MIREKETVLDAIKSWIHAYETRDVEKFKNILSPSETHISWGTGRDERYVGLSNFLHQANVTLRKVKVQHLRFSILMLSFTIVSHGLRSKLNLRLSKTASQQNSR